MILKILLGEMAEQLLLQGQKAVPKKLTDSGFKFSFPECEDALNNLTG
jgi:NAD dependent epimerase/dehydratase family enzyme